MGWEHEAEGQTLALGKLFWFKSLFLVIKVLVGPPGPVLTVLDLQMSADLLHGPSPNDFL